MGYFSLPDEYLLNIDYILKRADNSWMKILQSEFNISKKRKSEESRKEILHGVMFGAIPFDFFIEWLCHVELEGNNSVFIYEAEENDFLSNITIDELYEANQQNVVPIYELNPNTLNEITLVNVKKISSTEQLLLSFAAPAIIHNKKNQNSLEFKKHIYLAYIVVDFDMKTVNLYLHPTSGLYSICTIPKKRELDELAWLFMKYFTDNILKFTYKNPEWLHEALSQISSEYFAHNNPLIDLKVNSFLDNCMDEIIETVSFFDADVKKEDSLLRIKSGIKNIYESELVDIHNRIETNIKFHVFLQQSDRGATQYKANSRGKTFSYAESKDIIQKMSEHAELFNIGIVHFVEDKQFPYIVKKSEKYFSLKKYTTSGTEKEVIDDVLRKLNEYKHEIESIYSYGESDDFERRIDDAKA
ncbi:hypothetical protein [Exiguobacterium sp. s63]|uniref:hypothetical protein n=1 Tax=Exiguobacterium sp. s63 TaxID=2751274 RepID=UPI001BEB337B|nr:hypothetical protein [Exiguobacterium sp. s63]